MLLIVGSLRSSPVLRNVQGAGPGLAISEPIRQERGRAKAYLNPHKARGIGWRSRGSLARPMNTVLQQCDLLAT
jgi:hypothetical protein